MAVLSATCATLAAAIAAAQPGDVVDLPLQPARCGYVRLNRIRKDPPGVLVRIHPQQRVGLHITNSSGIAFQGGHLEGAASAPDGRHGQSGIYVTASSNLAFRGATFGHPDSGTMVGAFIMNSSDIEIADSTFAWARADGIQARDSERLRFIDNTFTSNGAVHSTCTYPDGRVVVMLNGARCTREGGVWRDGTHPDAIQIYSNVQDVLVARNRLSGWFQGIGWHGPGGERGIRRVWVVDNEVRTIYTWGIRMPAEGSLVRGNRIGWPEGETHPEGWGTVIGGPPAVLCENVRLRGGGFAPWNADYSGPCPSVLPPLPAPPRWVPESVRGATAQSLPDML